MEAAQRNIVMIGMPGAGKSTIGVVLAKVLCFEFLDSDLLIQRRTGVPLSETIDKLGTEGFLALEDEVCASIDAERTVIATGGSAVYGERAMRHLRENGIVVYLRYSCEAILERLGDLSARGVVLRDGQSFQALFDERCALYERYADVIVEPEERDVRGSLQLVLEALNAHTNV